MRTLRLLGTSALVSALSCGGSAVVLRSTQNRGFVELFSENATTANPVVESSSILPTFELASSSVCPAAIFVDGCQLIDCPSPLPKSWTPARAGTIVVTGARQPISVPPKSPDYDYVQLPQRLWDGGETLRLAVPGDTAPAFDLSIVAPAYVMVDAPAWPTGGAPLAIPRAKELDVTWSGGGAGFVGVDFQVTLDQGFYNAYCTYPAGSGAGKVSARVLGALPTGSAYTIEIYSVSLIETAASGWFMDFSAIAAANAPTGLASAAFVLQ
ncbi:MAG TPA: hypothetical protein VF316_02130 [Polyangiaceae bacterium]